MKRFFAAALLMAGSGVTSAQAADCPPETQERLVAATLYREARPTREAHASVMAVIINRMKSPKWRARTICQVITSPNQFVYRLPAGTRGPALQMARESARTFLNELRTHGTVHTQGHVFRRLARYDSFHTANRRSARPGRITLHGNTFYIAGRN